MAICNLTSLNVSPGPLYTDPLGHAQDLVSISPNLSTSVQTISFKTLALTAAGETQIHKLQIPKCVLEISYRANQVAFNINVVSATLKGDINLASSFTCRLSTQVDTINYDRMAVFGSLSAKLNSASVSEFFSLLLRANTSVGCKLSTQANLGITFFTETSNITLALSSSASQNVALRPGSVTCGLSMDKYNSMQVYLGLQALALYSELVVPSKARIFDLFLLEGSAAPSLGVSATLNLRANLPSIDVNPKAAVSGVLATTMFGTLAPSLNVGSGLLQSGYIAVQIKTLAIVEAARTGDMRTVALLSAVDVRSASMGLSPMSLQSASSTPALSILRNATTPVLLEQNSLSSLNNKSALEVLSVGSSFRLLIGLTGAAAPSLSAASADLTYAEVVMPTQAVFASLSTGSLFLYTGMTSAPLQCRLRVPGLTPAGLISIPAIFVLPNLVDPKADIKSSVLNLAFGMFSNISAAASLEKANLQTSLAGTSSASLSVEKPISTAFRVLVGMNASAASSLSIASSQLLGDVLMTGESTPGLSGQAFFINVLIGMQGESSPSLVAGSSDLSYSQPIEKQLSGSIAPRLLFSVSPYLSLLGGPDTAQQVQEYSRYSIPTGTSVASPTDEDGNPVNYSHSVFGSILFRLDPAQYSAVDVSIQAYAQQLGDPSQYSTSPPTFNKTMVLLRTSMLNTASLQRTVSATQAVGPDVSRTAAYSAFPRSYLQSVGDVGSGGNSTLANPTAPTSPYAFPSVPMLVFGCSSIRHNFNLSASTTENSSVAVDYQYPDTLARKLVRSRVESTVPSVFETLSPIYSAPSFRLMTPAQAAQHAIAAGRLKANAVVIPQDDATPAAHIHASDALVTFLPMRDGARYSYNRHYPALVAQGLTVSQAGFVGGPPSSNPLEFTVLLSDSSGPVPPSTLYSGDADNVLRITLLAGTQSGLGSSVFVDIPVLGVSVNEPTKAVIDSSYRWYLEQCLPGGRFSSLHTIRCVKEYYTASNSAQSISSRAVLAVSRPIVSLIDDQGESAEALLSLPGERNLVLGEFSVAISRPDQSFSTDVKVNVEPDSSSALTIYDSSSLQALQVSSFDPNKLHLFIRADGSLAGRRTVSSYDGPRILTDLTPVLPQSVRDFIAAAGTFSKVKVGEGVTGLLSSGVTGKKLFLWGSNSYGQLDVPIAVDTGNNFASTGYISNVKEFDLSAGHVAVILDDGRLFSWGCTQSTVWRESGSPIVAMDIGENFSVAVVERFDPGSGNTKQVLEQYGAGPALSSQPSSFTLASPSVLRAATSGVNKQINAGKVLACGSNHAVLLKSDGTVACWGDNTYGQSTPPASVTQAGSNIIAVDAGDNHCMALKSNGEVICWGRDHLGQSTVPTGLRAKQISAGGNFCAALRRLSSTDVSAVNGSVTNDMVEDTAACWGDNSKGQCNVPVCEGISYDPRVHRYRLRFWSLECGWDHVIALRKDDDSGLWVRDHPELNHSKHYNLLRVPLRTSGGQLIFACIRAIRQESSTGTLRLLSSTGQAYSLTELSPGTYATPSVVTSGGEYRLYTYSALNNFGYSVVAQKLVSGSWQTLTFDATQYIYDQSSSVTTFEDLTLTTVGWDGISFPPKWACRQIVNPGDNIVIQIGAAIGSLEYLAIGVRTAELADPGLNWNLFAWGNPMAYSTSCSSADYAQYYGSLPIDSLLEDDMEAMRTYPLSSSSINDTFSYMGFGKQLGANIGDNAPSNLILSNRINAGTAQFGGFSSSIYLGSRSLQTAPLEEAFSTQIASDGSTLQYGASMLFMTISGSLRLFERPTPISSTEIFCYVTPENNNPYATRGPDNVAIGFNNRAPYCERLLLSSLPASFVILPNNDPQLPVNTPQSASGYHLYNTTYGHVYTGAYIGTTSAGSTGIVLPFNDVFNVSNQGLGIGSSAALALNLTARRARVIRHQLNDPQAGTALYLPGKHVTHHADSTVVGFDIISRSYGLGISSSSPLRGPDVEQTRTIIRNSQSQLQVFAKYRSILCIDRSRINMGTAPNPIKRVCMTKWAGDNTKGQLNLLLFGHFAMTTAEAGVNNLNLSTNWLMNFGQTVIGNSESPSLPYTFKKVVCGQFHTLAIDADGWVHAKGLNNPLRAPKSEVIPWDPFQFGRDGCWNSTEQSGRSLISGYFSAISSEGTTPGSACAANFSCNRARSTFPSSATNNKDLSGGALPYPNGPSDWSDTENTCYGSYFTSGALFFDSGRFEGSDIPLISQQVNGPGLAVGLENAAAGSRLYVTDTLSGIRQYSDPFDANPSLIYVQFADFSTDLINPSIPVAAKINGKYITWAGQDKSPPVSVLSYRKFMHGVGSLASLSPRYSRNIQREFMPTTAPTSMVAGDTFFASLYLNETDTASQIRGSLVGDIFNGNTLISLGYTSSQSQGSMVPTLDFKGPKQYFISKVNRSYNVSGAIVPAGAVYSGATPAPSATTVTYNGDDANPNFKIYFGQDILGSSAAQVHYRMDSTITSPEYPSWGFWPKVVYPGDPNFSSATVPTQVFCFRRMSTVGLGLYDQRVDDQGFSSGNNVFEFTNSTGIVSDDGAHPAKRIVGSTPESRVISIDSSTNKLLPQSYYAASSDIPVNPKRVELGFQTVFAVKQNDKLYSWGSDQNEQRAVADDLNVTNTWKMVAPSSSFSIGLTLSGEVKLLRSANSFFQPPSTLGSCTWVAAAQSSAAAVDASGFVVTWGDATDGTLAVPPTLGACTAVCGGQSHFAALKSNGTVACWGNNDFGQCEVPATLSNVVKVVCGNYHTAALKSDGTIVCWGRNDANQCNVPAGLTGCLDVATGSFFTVAIRSTQKPVAWGLDSSDNNFLVTAINQLAAGVSNFVRLGSGWANTYMWMVTSVGSLQYAGPGSSMGDVNWNPETQSRYYANFSPSFSVVGPYKHVAIGLPPSSSEAQLTAAIAAIPSSLRARNPDLQYPNSIVSSLRHAVDIASGADCYFAVLANSYTDTSGSLVAWGSSGSDGVLQVPAGTNYTTVACRNRHAAALTSSNSLICWGDNTYGQCNVPAGSYLKVSCGDTFTAAIRTDNKLVCWGLLNGATASVPAPYSSMTFSEVSCGKDHIVARVLQPYEEFVPGGIFRVSAGDVVAFGNNASGQCDIPGFSYTSNNKGINCSAVAGGDFTAFVLPTQGFQLTSYATTSPRAIVTTDEIVFENQTALNLSSRLEGYVVHRAAAFCPTILPQDHPYAINPPTSSVDPNGDLVGTFFQSSGFLPNTALVSNATSVPLEYQRNGAKRAKLVAAGRFPYYLQRSSGRFYYGSGYSVVVGEDNTITVFGGELRPEFCVAGQYSLPLEALAIRDYASSGITEGDSLIQLDTILGQVYALKLSGDLVRWGYDDSLNYGSNFYQFNPDKKQYFSISDDGLRDTLPQLQFPDFANIAISYVGGVPGVQESWSVDIFLDRTFDGAKTNVRRFTATGNSVNFPIGKPVHFSETFLAVDTWPGEAQTLESQYVMSIVPRGVTCQVNSASMFLLNLDTRIGGGQRVFNDGDNMPASASQVADFFIVQGQGSGFASNSLASKGTAKIVSVNETVGSISLSSITDFEYPAYVRNQTGSSTRLDSVSENKRVANTSGRVASPQAVTPLVLPGVVAWFKNDTLPNAGGAIVSWANAVPSSSGGIAAFGQGVASLQPSSTVFNTSFKGAFFGPLAAQTQSNFDQLLSVAATAESEFTYFLVFKKTFNTAATHCSFGKYSLPTASTPRVQGVGFNQGNPVLFTGSTHDVASTSVGTSEGILCGYFASSLDKGLRVNGQSVSGYSATNQASFIPTSNPVGYHLGAAIAGTGTSANRRDSQDVYAEVVAFNRRLTADEIELVEGALAHRLNLQSSLPSVHPYRSSSPSWDSLDMFSASDLPLYNQMLVESNRMMGTRPQTWLGMFNYGVQHTGKRMSGTSVIPNHAPILAEISMSTLTTQSILTRVANCVLTTTANLGYSAPGSVYLNAATSLKLNVGGASLTLSNGFVTKAANCKLNVSSASAEMIIGMSSQVLIQVGTFGADDCVPGYGCFGTSEFPPELTINSGTSLLMLSSPALQVLPANLSAILNIKSTPTIKCSLACSATMSKTLNLSATSTPSLSANAGSLRSFVLFLDANLVSPNLSTLVCVTDFAVTGTSTRNLVYMKPFNTPDTTINPGGDAISFENLNDFS